MRDRWSIEAPSRARAPGSTVTSRAAPVTLAEIEEAFAGQIREADEVADRGVVLGDDYPFPLVEHDFARERALEMWEAHRRETGGELGQAEA